MKKKKQAQAMMELYKEHKVNPFSSILLLFIQLPVLLIALYQVFWRDLSLRCSNLYIASYQRPLSCIRHFGLDRYERKEYPNCGFSCSISVYSGIFNPSQD